MNIAERYQKEEQQKKKQEVEKLKGGYTALREIYEQEYRENKKKLSSDIKQDIKLISQKYPSFQKFALYKIYKQFDFNREIANEFISIQIQKEEQEQPDQNDDWVEVTSRKSTFLFKMSSDNSKNKPQRSQSVTGNRRERGSNSRSFRNEENNVSNYRERRNVEERRDNDTGERRVNVERDWRRNVSGENRQNSLQRGYSPRRERDYNKNNQTQNRRPKISNRKPQQSQAGSYLHQPRVIYVPKQEEHSYVAKQDEVYCPYIEKSLIIQQKENCQPNLPQPEESKTNQSQRPEENLGTNQQNLQIDNQQNIEKTKEKEAQLEQQKQDQLEQQKQQQQIENERKQQQLLQIKIEQQRQEQIKLEEIKRDQQLKEQLLQIKLDREKQQQAKEQQERLHQEQLKAAELESKRLEKVRLEQQRLEEEQRQYELLLQQQQEYQKQFSHQGEFQPLKQPQASQFGNQMFVPQFNQSQGQIQQQTQQQQQQQPSVYHMLLSYINYQQV